MISADEVDEELEDEVTSECSKFGVVERVVIYQERQGIDEDAEVIVKIFVVFATHAGMLVLNRHTKHINPLHSLPFDKTHSFIQF